MDQGVSWLSLFSYSSLTTPPPLCGAVLFYRKFVHLWRNRKCSRLVDTLLLNRLINEALKQSPNNPEANGFGFGFTILVIFCAFCVAGLAFSVRSYIRMVRERDRERKAQAKQDREDRDKARDTAAKQIDGRIDKLEGLVADELGNIRKHVNDFLREHENKFTTTREELAILKEKVNHLEKDKK